MKRVLVLAALCLALAACSSTPHGATPTTATGSTGTGNTGNNNRPTIAVHDQQACRAFWQIHNDTIETQLNDPQWPTMMYQGGVALDVTLKANINALAYDVADYNDQEAVSVEQAIASDCTSDGFTS